MKTVKIFAVLLALGLNVFSADGWLTNPKDVIDVQVGEFSGKKVVLFTLGDYNNTSSFLYYGFEADGSPMADYMLALVLEGENRWQSTNVNVMSDNAEAALLVNGTISYKRAKAVDLVCNYNH